MRVSYVILHYITYEDTIQCIKSIFKYTDLDKINLNIIVVDNNSPDDSLSKIKKSFDRKEIKYIHLDKNEGFARGNNAGFSYAKKHFSPDYIIMCNNDTELTSGDIYKEMDRCYKKYNYAVMGPRELLPNGQYYPLSMSIPSLKKLEGAMRQYRTDIFCYRLHLEKLQMTFYNKFPSLRFQWNQIELNNSKFHEDIVLHGAFLIFSKVYIGKFDGIDPRTFLYGEEYLLQQRIKSHKMISLFNPKIIIKHKKGQATGHTAGGWRKKAIRRLQYELNSFKVLKKELKKD